MKKTDKVLIFIILLLPSVILSQISISQNDFTSIYSIGSTHTSFADTLTESVDIGVPGGPNNWDFSSFIAHQSFETNYILPEGTPFADTFATANRVGHMMYSFDEGGTTGTSETWTYYSTDDATNHGSGAITVFTESGMSDTTINVTKHFPPFNQYDFPIDFEKEWTVQDSSETLILSTEGNFTTVQKTMYNVVIDAWGTMKLPSGKIVDALRSREQSISTSFVFGIPIGSSTSVHYFFMAKSGESFSILSDSENPPNSGVITGSVGWSDDAVTEVKKIDSVPVEFSLKQNYPNPFNPSTTIEYSINKNSIVKLKIYDVLGKEISELVNEKQSPGNYRYSFNAAQLVSGTYFIQLQSGSNIEIRKMTLLK